MRPVKTSSSGVGSWGMGVVRVQFSGFRVQEGGDGGGWRALSELASEVFFEVALDAPEALVETFLAGELVVGALLGNAAVFEDDDAVGVHEGGEAVGDEEGG